MEFKVTWIIDIEADSAIEAAKIARVIQLDPTNLASFFTVDDGSLLGAEQINVLGEEVE